MHEEEDSLPDFALSQISSSRVTPAFLYSRDSLLHLNIGLDVIETRRERASMLQHRRRQATGSRGKAGERAVRGAERCRVCLAMRCCDECWNRSTAARGRLEPLATARLRECVQAPKPEPRRLSARRAPVRGGPCAPNFNIAHNSTSTLSTPGRQDTLARRRQPEGYSCPRPQTKTSEGLDAYSILTSASVDHENAREPFAANLAGR